MTSRPEVIRWVVRAQSGDMEALDALLKDIQEPLYHYLLRVVGDDHLARDVLQDVFVLIIRKLCWLREPKVFRSWAYRIASRQVFRCLQRLRRLDKPSADNEVLASLPGETHEEIDPELLQRLSDLLGEVSPASRAVLSLHYFDGMTLREIGDVLEISLAAVKSRLAYGLSVLRKLLGVCRE